MSRFAEGTAVPVDRSRGEISGILAAHMLTKSGQTVGELVAGGALPMLGAGGR